ncbi:MAG: glutathione S-transferase [Arenicella sp.]|nr:glutathione S-transferase [Arenicella sp.]
MPVRYTLYGAEMSLYSGKVRSYLRKKGLAFNEVAASVKTYRDVIIPETGVKFIPVVRTPEGKFLQDTSVIIKEIDSQHPDHSALPATPRQRLVAELLEVYADEWLILPAMHYRWNFPEKNQPFIYREFGRFVLPWAPAFIRGWVGKKAGARFKGAVTSLGITAKTIPAIEASYGALLDDLQAHFLKHQFLLGSKPCIADFGFIGPLYAHLYRDPYPSALMRKRAPAVARWVERMMDTNAYLQQGSLLANDEIPKTIEPILKRMGAEQYPVLKASNKALNEWRRDTPHALGKDIEVARRIGTHKFTLDGVKDKRVILPYSLWMLQRVLESRYVFKLINDYEFDDWLEKVGLGGILNFTFDQPMHRIDNKLYFRKVMA